MSTLILVFHPHLKDGSRVNARLLAELAAQGEDDIIVRDEYAEYPNFSVNADTEHELLEPPTRNPPVPVLLVLLPRAAQGMGRRGHHRRLGLRWRPRTQGKELKLVVTTGSDAASTARTASTATPWRSC
mgnify:CR=1 FL=1